MKLSGMPGLNVFGFDRRPLMSQTCLRMSHSQIRPHEDLLLTLRPQDSLLPAESRKGSKPMQPTLARSLHKHCNPLSGLLLDHAPSGSWDIPNAHRTADRPKDHSSRSRCRLLAVEFEVGVDDYSRPCALSVVKVRQAGLIWLRDFLVGFV